MSRSTNIPSSKQTPHTPRPFSTGLKVDSVNEGLMEDIVHYFSNGIGFEELVKVICDMGNDSYAAFKTQAQSWVHPPEDPKAFDDILKKYLDLVRANVVEQNLYEPLAQIFNFILGYAMTSLNTPADRRIKVIVTNDSLTDGLKPDLCIVPESLQFEKSKADKKRKTVTPRSGVGSRKVRGLPRRKTGSGFAAPARPDTGGVAETTAAANEDAQNSFDPGSTTSADQGDSSSRPDTAEVAPNAEDDLSNAIASNVDLAQSGNDDTFNDGIHWDRAISSIEVKRDRLFAAMLNDDSEPEGSQPGSSKRVRTAKSVDVSSSASRLAPTHDEENPLYEPTHKRAVGGNTSLRLQNTRYAARALSFHGDREFFIIPLITAGEVKMMFFSREGIVESDAMDFANDHSILAVVLGLFVIYVTDLPRLGFDAKMGFFNPFDPNDQSTRRPTVSITPITKEMLGNSQDTQPDLTRLELGENLTSRYGLIGRGSTVSRLKSDYKHKLVVKQSWQVKTRRLEDEAIKLARQVDERHVVEIFGSAVACNGNDGSILKRLRERCSMQSTRFEERELRVLILREYEDISKLGVTEEFIDAIVQIMTCLHDLNKKQIRHRDISMFNIMYHREGEEVVAVLIDFDLATYPPFDKDPTSGHRTGTAPFMAYELLNDSKCEHTLQHDLESCMHCILWHGAGYSDFKKSNGEVLKNYPRAMSFFRDWRVGSWKEMALAKLGFYTTTSATDFTNYLKKVDVKYADICKRLVQLLWSEYVECTLRRNESEDEDDNGLGPQGSRLTYARGMIAVRSKMTCNEACCH